MKTITFFTISGITAIILGLFSIYLICKAAYSDNFKYRSNTVRHVSFLQMLKYYHVNPDNWELDESYPIYNPEYGVRYYFKFSYLDYLFHYKKFYRNYKRDKKEAKQLKYTEEFLKYIQKDIDILKKQANEEIKQAQEELQQAANTYILLGENIYYNKNDKNLYAKDIATDKFYLIAETIMGE